MFPMMIADGAGAVGELAAEESLIRHRWPDGVRCPRCGAADAAGRKGKGRRRWRCRGCRHDFCVTTGTCLHASKAPLAAWVGAALGAPASQPGTVAASTRRRIRRTVESTGLGPGPERLAALVGAAHAPLRPGPLAGLAEGHRRVLAVLRTRLAGATAERVAADCGLSESHTRRCLRRLRDAGFVESSQETVMWGYTPRWARLWRLAMSEQALDALPQMGWLPQAEPPGPSRSGAAGVLVPVLVRGMRVTAPAPPRLGPRSRHPHRRPQRAGAHMGSHQAAAAGAARPQLNAGLQQRPRR